MFHYLKQTPAEARWRNELLYDMTMELHGDRHQFNRTNGENRLDQAPPTQNFVTHPNTFRRTPHLKSQLAANYSYDFIRENKTGDLPLAGCLEECLYRLYQN
jgi:hypothetical protein